MPNVLITGANRGLGLEFARQYVAEGWRVLATCRDPDRASALKEISGDVRVAGLDVGRFESIDRLAGELGAEAIDVLINNAGIYGGRPQGLGRIDYDAWAETLRIDCLAQIRVAEAFLDHVARSERKVIVAISSKMGSIADNSSGGTYIYRSAKAALNMAMRSLAHDVADRGIVAAVLHPGWVETDMGGPNALIGPAESIAGMRQVIAGLDAAKSGGFYDYRGAEVPW